MKLQNEHLLDLYKFFSEHYKRYTIFSDLHIPFEDEKLIKRALQECKGDALIIAGDLIDGYSASYYPKDKPITFEEEINQCQEWMYTFSKRFDKIYICLGNHDYRIIKQLEQLPFGIVSFVKDNVLNGFLNAIRVKSNIVVGAWWLMYIDKMFIAHADTYSKMPVKPVITLQDYLAKIHPEKYAQCNAILQGHTHHIGMTISYHKILLQLPTMQKTAYYRYKDKITSSINYEWHKGWVDLELCKDGLTPEGIKIKIVKE